LPAARRAFGCSARTGDRRYAVAGCARRRDDVGRTGPSFMIDLLLSGGVVYDGLGGEGQTADVAVADDRVVAVGRDLGSARRVIDVDGLAVAPGFIDPHSHSDMVPLMDDPQPFKLFQGVTTEIVGNCGYSFAPLTPESAQEAALSFG